MGLFDDLPPLAEKKQVAQREPKKVLLPSKKEPYKKNFYELKEDKSLENVLTKEEIANIEATEGKSTTTDILDFIDNINRPFYGVTSVIKEALTDDEFGDITPDDYGDAFKRGFKREEKIGTRDLLKILDPNTINYLEKNTKFKPFGVEALESDVLTLPTFIGDILLDPLTYIPISTPLKILKLGGSGVKKGLSVIAKGALSPKAIAAAEKFMDRAIGKITYYTDKVAHLRNVDKRLAKEGLIDAYAVEPGEALEKYLSKTAASGTKSIEKATTATFLEGLGRVASGEVENKVLGKGTMESIEDANIAFATDLANEYKIGAQSLFKAIDVDDLTKKIKAAESPEERTQLANALMETIGPVKAKHAKEISEAMMEDGGIKKILNVVMKYETDVTKQFQKASQKVKKGLLSTAIKEKTGRIDAVRKAAKSSGRNLSRMMNQEVKGIFKGVEDFEKDMTKFISGTLSEDALPVVMDRLKGLESRVAGLGKYEASKIPQITIAGRLTDASQIRGTIQKNLKGIINNMDRMARSEVGDASDYIRREFLGVTKGLKTSLKEFSKANAGLAKSSLRDTMKAGSQLSQEITDNLFKEVSRLNVERQALVKELATVRTQSKFGGKELRAFQKTRAARIYRALADLKNGSAAQSLLRNKKFEYEALIKSGLTKRLPEELRESGWNIYKELQKSGSELKGVGLLESANPFYFPRRYKFDMIDDVSRKLTVAGKGTGFLKKRKFRFLNEAKEWVEANGGEVQTDAQVLLADYFDKVEHKIAKKQLTDALLSRFEKAKMQDLPNSIQNTLDYIFRDGFGPPVNEVVGKAFKVYGNILNKTKALLTVINPAFHGRNILGFPFLAASTAGMKAGFNPANYSDAMLLMAGEKGDDLLRKIGGDVVKVTTKGGETVKYTMQEIRDAAKESGYFGSSFLRGDIEQEADALFNRYTKGSPRWFMSKVFKASAAIEDMGRYGALMANLRDGNELPEAIRLAKKAMFDYNLINSPVDKAVNGLVGFYTFSRRNLPRQFATLLNDPKQYAVLSRVLEKISNQESLIEEELEAMNGYDKNTFKIFGGVVDGVREFRTLGFLPAEEAYQTIAGMTRGGLEEKMKFMAGRVNPVMKSFMDFYYEEDPTFGGDFGNTLPAAYSQVLNEKLAEQLGFHKVAKPRYRGGEVVGEDAVYTGPRRLVALIRALPTNRFLNDLKNLRTKEDVLGYLTGIKKKELDVDASQFFQRQAARKKLREVAQERGAKVYENVYVPKTLRKEEKEEKEERVATKKTGGGKPRRVARTKAKPIDRQQRLTKFKSVLQRYNIK